MIFRKKEDELEKLRNEVCTLWRSKGFSEKEIEQRLLDVEINSTKVALATIIGKDFPMPILAKNISTGEFVYSFEKVEP